MAATMATSAKCMSLNPSPPKPLNQTKPTSSKPFITLPTPPKPTVSLAVTSTALAGAVFSALSYSEPALAAHQIAELAAAAGGSDNRGLALLLPIVPAIGWVLFNILQPALNQINKMRESRGIVVGLGIGGGLAASGLLTPPPEAVAAAEAAERAGDNRGQLLLFVVAPALLWVLYNILQPALNQLNKMRSQ
ncbi:Photosystem II core complex proteins psbY [Hirschfeldia incana]|nr:Photosystem II core complex proteins psbY [Hirschfeldia incana]